MKNELCKYNRYLHTELGKMSQVAVVFCQMCGRACSSTISQCECCERGMCGKCATEGVIVLPDEIVFVCFPCADHDLDEECPYSDM